MEGNLYLNEQETIIQSTLFFQLEKWFPDLNYETIGNAITFAIDGIERCFNGSPNKRFFDGKNVLFSPYNSIQWMLLLYRVSHEIYKADPTAKEADAVYYLNKIMHSNEWFYAVELPIHFLAEHPLGSVLGRAKYGDYFFIYQGTTVGGNRSNGVLSYPVIGENVIMFANSTILGKSNIGNNVVVAADTFIINQDVPDNCVVSGKSPNITIIKKTENQIKEYTKHIWGWK